MLTHVHMVVYTWWCWHIFKGGGVPRVERGVGSSLPPAELERRDSTLLRKLSVYFLLRRYEIWRSCGSVSRTGRWCWQHRTLVQSVRCGVSLWLRCTECTGCWHRTLGGYCSSVRWCMTSASAREEFLTVEHRTLRVRPVACVR